MWIPYADVAAELDVPIEDVRLVAYAELVIPDEHDDDREAVTDEGRARLVEHFRGGRDPG